MGENVSPPARRPRPSQPGRLVWVSPGQPVRYLGRCRWCDCTQRLSAGQLFVCQTCDEPAAQPVRQAD